VNPNLACRKTALAIHNVDFEGLGTLRQTLEARGYAIQPVDALTADWDAVAKERADLVVVLGGTLGVADEPAYPFLSQELRFIRQCLAQQVPLLGICLGAQLIARALGASVRPMGVKEIGFAPLQLTPEGAASALGALAGVPVLLWHGDMFDIPPGARRLAHTAICQNQAYALGQHVLGLQFHLEADARDMERWLVGNAAELAQVAGDPHNLRAQAARHGPAMAEAAQRVFGQWLDALPLHTNAAETA